MEQLDSSEDFNIQALGEYQNLASLLPLILTIEYPDPQLKDNVAKKLYRLKDEIKAQRQKNKPSANIQDAIGEKEQDSSLKELEILTSENGVVEPDLTEENELQNIVEETIDISNNRKIPPTRQAIPVKKNYRIVIWGIVLFSLLVIGVIVTYLNISLKTNNLTIEVENLKKEVELLIYS